MRGVCKNTKQSAKLVRAEELLVLVGGAMVARHTRCFERERIHYGWQHHIAVVRRKPGALRDGAPFLNMPDPLGRP